jgi:SNF family Na+-dependent transporter
MINSGLDSISGAFLIPFIVMVFVAGLPLMFMELAIGQYSNMSPVILFDKFCPLFSGLGTHLEPLSTNQTITQSINFSITMVTKVTQWFSSRSSSCSTTT